MLMLPATVDRTPRGKWVLSAEICTQGYIDNECFSLIIEHRVDGIAIRYEGDGDYEIATPKDIEKIIKLYNP